VPRSTAATGDRERLHFEFEAFAVMPGLVPGIHVFLLSRANKAWMAGSSPAMTRECAVSN
jgi:hypothetical protein